MHEAAVPYLQGAPACRCWRCIAAYQLHRRATAATVSLPELPTACKGKRRAKQARIARAGPALQLAGPPAQQALGQHAALAGWTVLLLSQHH